MRRSNLVFAPILASAATALLTGCHTNDPQQCVDEQNHVVNPSFCQNLQPGQTVAGTPVNSGGYYGSNGIFYPHLFRYYYGGSSSGIGSMVYGGSYAPTPGHRYSIGGTSRGGFGSSFGGEGHGSSGGE